MNATTPDLTAITQDLLDPSARKAIRHDPRQYAVDSGMLQDNATTKVKVVANGPDTMYITFPQNIDNIALSHDELQVIQAAGDKVSTVGTSGSASTLGCITLTISSTTTASTIGSAGSIDT